MADRIRNRLVGAASIALLTASGPVWARSAAGADQPDAIDFNRDVRPILSDNCFQCHGPDEAARQAGLRLDTQAGATAERAHGRAVVPGDADASLMMARLLSEHPGKKMPPPEANREISDHEIEILRQWIDQGAEWAGHWAFLAPDRPHPPRVEDTGWVSNHIDSFVLARLESEDIRPSRRANRATLLRRASLDVTGLPPTLDDLEAFLGDTESDAYQRAVDRLLDSPRYGEHMTRYWLDAARYADTHGLHLDNRREIWRWRDWVIESFNSNMPFDQFTIEQLAGDLLPDPTLGQLIATGFNRNHVTTSEGGSIDDEYHVKYAVDRTETMSTIWLGLTAGCAACHDHKFDPITQREFYELYAFFNNIDQPAMDGNRPDTPPVILAPTEAQQAQLDERMAEVDRLRTQVEAPNDEVDRAQQAWEARLTETARNRWTPAMPLEMHTANGAILEVLEDGSVLASGPNPDKEIYDVVYETDAVDARVLRLEVLMHPSLPLEGHGRFDNSNIVLSEIEVEVESQRDPTQRRSLRFTAGVADHEQENNEYWAEKAIDGIVDDTNGWATEGHVRVEDRVALFLSDAPFGYEGGTRLHVKFRHESHFERHTLGRFRVSTGGGDDLVDHLASAMMSSWAAVGPFAGSSAQDAYDHAFGPEVEPGEIDHRTTYDANLTWTEHPEWADGTVHKLSGSNGVATYLHRTIDVPTARTMAFSFGSDGAIKVWLNGELILNEYVLRPAAPDQNRVDLDLQPGRNDLLVKIVNGAGGYAFFARRVREADRIDYPTVTDLLALDERTDAQDGRVREYFRRRHNPVMHELFAAIDDRRADADAYRATLPITLIARERKDRRPAHLLGRGEYDQPGEEVQPDVPTFLPALEPDAPRNRLGLAQWLVRADHPLTARVTVNRIWQRYFGTGLVETSEDFGAQGAWPSHPDLLDWLAVDFVANGWDLKRLHRMILTSSTYQQDSARRHDLEDLDPENRLLARGPRYRLDAEVIRDQALAVSGLLVETIGGPSVRPSQPDGVWAAVAYPDSDTARFVADGGDSEYRRSLYTFWKRTSPPPNMVAFDAPTRESCIVRRSRTNSPMQSLVMLNDPHFVHAARSLAARVLREAEPSTDARLTYLYQLVVSRQPTTEERSQLHQLLDAQHAAYQDDPDAASTLIASNDRGDVWNLDEIDHAVWTILASTLMSLDESMTKG